MAPRTALWGSLLVGLLLLLTVDARNGGGRRDNPATETKRECFDHKDNDGDGLTDCKDPDCLKDRRIAQRCKIISGHSAGAGKPKGKGACVQSQSTKCKGPGKVCPLKGSTNKNQCLAQSGMDYETGVQRCCSWYRDQDPKTETKRECSDGIDNDHDGVTDCDDPDCLKDKRIKQRCMILERHKTGVCMTRKGGKGGQVCPHEGVKDFATCMSGVQKGKKAVCRWFHDQDPHTETGSECFDHKDNDGDGLSDCSDPDCQKDKRAAKSCQKQLANRKNGICVQNQNKDCRSKKITCAHKGSQVFNTCVSGGKSGCCRWWHDKDSKTETAIECFDGVDNDGDGLTDCKDPDCLKNKGIARRCKIAANGYCVQSGGKTCKASGTKCGHIDSTDYAACVGGGRASCCSWYHDSDTKTETKRECFDGKDNDGDGKSDCEDKDCLTDPRVQKRCQAKSRAKNGKCTLMTGRTCRGKSCALEGGKDLKACQAAGKAGCCRWFNDQDPKTETKSECYDGKDNDGDGLTDCKDPDCLKDKRIAQRCQMKHGGGGHEKKEHGKSCFDHKDNDGDGLADCKDPDCLKNPNTARRCQRMVGGGGWGEPGGGHR